MVSSTQNYSTDRDPVSSDYLNIIRMEREGVETAGVEGLMSGVQRMGIRGGKTENLEKRGCGSELGKSQKLCPAILRMGTVKRRMSHLCPGTSHRDAYCARKPTPQRLTTPNLFARLACPACRGFHAAVVGGARRSAESCAAHSKTEWPAHDSTDTPRLVGS